MLTRTLLLLLILWLILLMLLMLIVLIVKAIRIIVVHHLALGIRITTIIMRIHVAIATVCVVAIVSIVVVTIIMASRADIIALIRIIRFDIVADTIVHRHASSGDQTTLIMRADILLLIVILVLAIAIDLCLVFSLETDRTAPLRVALNKRRLSGRGGARARHGCRRGRGRCCLADHPAFPLAARTGIVTGRHCSTDNHCHLDLIRSIIVRVVQ